MTQAMMDFCIAELKRELCKYGSCFAGGKQRIYDYFTAGTHDNTECAAMLNKEYGIGGHSWTFSDGTGGWFDHDGKGITVTVGSYADKTTNACTFTWPQVASIIRELIADGEFGAPPVPSAPPAPAVDDDAQLSVFDMLA